MVLKYSFFIISFFLAGGLKAQILSRNEINFGIGINQLKEENLHSKVHSGFLLQPSYSHRFKSQNISEYQVTLGYSKIKTRYEDLNASVNLQFNNSYRYLIMYLKNDKFSLATGPGVNLQYNVSYYPKWDDSHLYWANNINLSMDSQIFYTIRESKLIKGYFGLSLLSFISRPVTDRQYKIDDLSFGGITRNFHSFSQLLTVDKFLKISSEIEYYNQLSPVKAHGLFYAYDYFRVQGFTSNLFQNGIHQLGFKHYFK